jgi:hypothetical protein
MAIPHLLLKLGAGNCFRHNHHLLLEDKNLLHYN